jgi:hypothetical protein
MTAGRAIYLVQRLVRPEFYEAYMERENVGLPVHACARAEDAERRRQELEQEARRVVCPFLLGAPTEYSTLEAPDLADRFRALGLRRLPRTFDWESAADWLRWWDEHAETLTHEQRHGIWEALDRLRFYEVVEIELAD